MNKISDTVKIPSSTRIYVLWESQKDKREMMTERTSEDIMTKFSQIWVKIPSVDEDVKKCIKPLCTTGGIVKWCHHYREQYDAFSKN